MNMAVYYVIVFVTYHFPLLQKKINMARGLEQGNMKHFVVSPSGDFLAFQGQFQTTSAAV